MARVLQRAVVQCPKLREYGAACGAARSAESGLLDIASGMPCRVCTTRHDVQKISLDGLASRFYIPSFVSRYLPHHAALLSSLNNPLPQRTSGRFHQEAALAYLTPFTRAYVRRVSNLPDTFVAFTAQRARQRARSVRGATSFTRKIPGPPSLLLRKAPLLVSRSPYCFRVAKYAAGGTRVRQERITTSRQHSARIPPSPEINRVRQRDAPAKVPARERRAVAGQNPPARSA